LLLKSNLVAVRKETLMVIGSVKTFFAALPLVGLLGIVGGNTRLVTVTTARR
jgi:hypothetical protein